MAAEKKIAIGEMSLRLANARFGPSVRLVAETVYGIIDVAETASAFSLSAPQDMDDLLQNDRAEDLAKILTATAHEPSRAVVLQVESLEFAPLVMRPEKILCVGFNYQKHAEETGTPIPKAPPLFSKFANALAHHGEVIELPKKIDYQFDYETELVIVFGRTCRDVAEADALDVVAGYTIGNDLSARGLQTATSQFLAGKASDGFAPIGPWLTTAVDIPDPNNLRLRTTVNGDVRQDWTTRDMIFDCRKLISYVTGIMTMKPGDVLFTGTPQGVIFGQKIPVEQRRWLRAGDEIVSSIQGLGELRITLA